MTVTGDTDTSHVDNASAASLSIIERTFIQFGLLRSVYSSFGDVDNGDGPLGEALSAIMNALTRLKDAMFAEQATSQREIAMQALVANYFLESDDVQPLLLRLAELTGVDASKFDARFSL